MIRLPCLVFSFVLLAAVSAGASPKECDPDKPENCAQFLGRGATAPFDGQLMTTSLAIDLGLKADSCDALVRIEVDGAKGIAKADLNLEKELRRIDADAHVKELKVVEADRDRWKKAAHVPFYERPWFVALLTAGALSGIVIGVAQTR